MGSDLRSDELIEIYEQLLQQIGSRKWWPADSPFEVIIGAILTQNTTWQNVKKAIDNLKNHDYLQPEQLAALPESELAVLIRPSGYYHQKAKKIKRFIGYFLNHYHGSIERMCEADTKTLRQELLAINGIGPETADSILLYALNKPTFVVDAYTKRIFARHEWMEENVGYHEVQNFFTSRLPQQVGLFNEFHALLDFVGHFYCRKKPLCHLCPLQDKLPIKKDSR